MLEHSPFFCSLQRDSDMFSAGSHAFVNYRSAFIVRNQVFTKSGISFQMKMIYNTFVTLFYNSHYSAVRINSCL